MQQSKQDNSRRDWSDGPGSDGSKRGIIDSKSGNPRERNWSDARSADNSKRDNNSSKDDLSWRDKSWSDARSADSSRRDRVWPDARSLDSSKRDRKWSDARPADSSRRDRNWSDARSLDSSKRDNVDSRGTDSVRSDRNWSDARSNDGSKRDNNEARGVDSSRRDKNRSDGRSDSLRDGRSDSESTWHFSDWIDSRGSRETEDVPWRESRRSLGDYNELAVTQVLPEKDNTLEINSDVEAAYVVNHIQQYLMQTVHRVLFLHVKRGCDNNKKNTVSVVLATESFETELFDVVTTQSSSNYSQLTEPSTIYNVTLEKLLGSQYQSLTNKYTYVRPCLPVLNIGKLLRIKTHSKENITDNSCNIKSSGLSCDISVSGKNCLHEVLMDLCIPSGCAPFAYECNIKPCKNRGLMIGWIPDDNTLDGIYLDISTGKIMYGDRVLDQDTCSISRNKEVLITCALVCGKGDDDRSAIRFFIDSTQVLKGKIWYIQKKNKKNIKYKPSCLLWGETSIELRFGAFRNAFKHDSHPFHGLCECPIKNLVKNNKIYNKNNNEKNNNEKNHEKNNNEKNCDDFSGYSSIEIIFPADAEEFSNSSQQLRSTWSYILRMLREPSIVKVVFDFQSMVEATSSFGHLSIWNFFDLKPCVIKELYTITQKTYIQNDNNIQKKMNHITEVKDALIFIINFYYENNDRIYNELIEGAKENIDKNILYHDIDFLRALWNLFISTCDGKENEGNTIKNEEKSTIKNEENYKNEVTTIIKNKEKLNKNEEGKEILQRPPNVLHSMLEESWPIFLPQELDRIQELTQKIFKHINQHCSSVEQEDVLNVISTMSDLMLGDSVMAHTDDFAATLRRGFFSVPPMGCMRESADRPESNLPMDESLKKHYPQIPQTAVSRPKHPYQMYADKVTEFSCFGHFSKILKNAYAVGSSDQINTWPGSRLVATCLAAVEKDIYTTEKVLMKGTDNLDKSNSIIPKNHLHPQQGGLISRQDALLIHLQSLQYILKIKYIELQTDKKNIILDKKYIPKVHGCQNRGIEIMISILINRLKDISYNQLKMRYLTLQSEMSILKDKINDKNNKVLDIEASNTNINQRLIDYQKALFEVEDNIYIVYYTYNIYIYIYIYIYI
eukprot:GHVL01019445.1.p1 GENE.GHVL01019445.1~~GHVL01019445.1.p1  ORF type:complete len:1124 (-),score=286.99 GHVL01019445.1:571-3942(-)